jgi:sugar lactone lactonase YvrE
MKPLLLLVLAFAGVAAPGAAYSATAKEFLPDAVVNPDAFYPEGPQLTASGLLVAEMPRDRVVLISGPRRQVVWHEEGCGPTSVKRIPSGGYWVLCHLGHHVVRLSDTFVTQKVYTQSASGRRINFPNDASVDSRGNLYLSSSGTFSLQAPPEGRVVFIDASTGAAADLVGGLRYSNGVLVQERQKRVLVSEHLNRRVLAFPLLDQGKLGKPSVFFDFRDAPPVENAYGHSGPDGIAAFDDGDVCVADYGNGRILVLSSAGRFLTQIDLKYRFVTNLAISPDQSSIYVTMTRDNSSERLDGIVQRFRIKTARE